MLFYKYAGEDGFRILEDLRLKITPPNEFNDPFEITQRSIFARPLNVMLQEVKTKPEVFRPVYEDMVRDGEFKGSFNLFIAGFPKALQHHYAGFKKLTKIELAKNDMKTLDAVSQELGILCLSKPPNSIPMWSYYADHHRGVVFGLNVDKIGGRLHGPCGLVKYCKQRARVNPWLPPGDAMHKQVLKTLFTKCADWKHEQEYRRVFQLSDLISYLPDKGEVIKYFLDIPSDAIQEIIFGCRARDELKSAIRLEVQRRKRTFGHIRLLRCERHPSRYELKILPDD